MYHINPKTGNPGVCHARRSCPFGDLQEDHYYSKEQARYVYEQKMNLPVSERKFKPLPEPKELMKKIDVPEGFTATETTTSSWDGSEENPTFVLTNDDGVEIKVEFYGETSPEIYSLGSGHVTFTTSQGTRTFDSHGNGPSFDVHNPNSIYATAEEKDFMGAVNENIRDMIERKIPEARARIAGSEPIPGTRLLATKKQKETLATTGSITITPGGFGTGYIFTTSKKNSWAKAGTVAQAKALGVDKLWIETFDHD